MTGPSVLKTWLIFIHLPYHDGHTHTQHVLEDLFSEAEETGLRTYVPTKASKENTIRSTLFFYCTHFISFFNPMVDIKEYTLLFSLNEEHATGNMDTADSVMLRAHFQEMSHQKGFSLLWPLFRKQITWYLHGTNI